MPSLFIRPATPADAPLIVQLIRDLAEYERAPQDAVVTEDLICESLFGRGVGNGLRGPSAECLIGEVDGMAQGLALFFHNYSTWLGRSGLYLEDLFVRPAARRAGLGKALLIRLAQIAVERGCGRLEWAVLDWNTPAIEFYKALGAKAMDEWTIYRLQGEAIARLAEAPRQAE
jgi:GNAT superfamily N-acetyltransferase